MVQLEEILDIVMDGDPLTRCSQRPWEPEHRYPIELVERACWLRDEGLGWRRIGYAIGRSHMMAKRYVVAAEPDLA
jgi:hypothetical protein